jgi:hypothetical protein
LSAGILQQTEPSAEIISAIVLRSNSINIRSPIIEKKLGPLSGRFRK